MRRLLFALLLALIPSIALAASGQGQYAAYSTTAANGVEKSAVVCSGPCHLVHASWYNSSASTRYIQFFNKTTLPADGAIPIQTYSQAATSGNGLYGWAEWYSVGLVMACSTTATVLTITGSNECFFHGLGE